MEGKAIYQAATRSSFESLDIRIGTGQAVRDRLLVGSPTARMVTRACGPFQAAITAFV